MVIEDMFANMGEEEDDEWNNYSKAISNSNKGKNNRQQNVIDVLKATSAMMTLDEKVNQLNLLLSNVFPAVKGDKVTFIG